jgi:hypothetical protein
MTDYDILPNKAQLDAYINHHTPVGSFLTAVLANDLREAVGRADSRNLPLLPLYVQYLYNEAPSACWGSLERVGQWLEAGHAQAYLDDVPHEQVSG